MRRPEESPDVAAPTASSDVEARLRSDARAVFEAALEAVEPAGLVRRALEADGVSVPDGGRLLLIAVGKAGLAMARGAVEALERPPEEAVALVPAGSGGRAPEGIRVYRGGHPLPDQEGLEGARCVHELLRRTGPADRVLLLLSGGGSALLSLPHPDVSLDDLRRVTLALLRSGAPVQETNAVRKHLEELKGGRLAALAEPAPVRALVLSDVVGDDPEVIASGPVSPDSTTFADAIAFLEDRGIWDDAPASVRRHLVLGREGEVRETPREGDAAFRGVRLSIVGNAATGAEAARRKAVGLGYTARLLSVGVTGEAREVGAELGEHAHRLVRGEDFEGEILDLPAALVMAGETTVTVRGDGRGGRNQEVALGAARTLDGLEGALVLSAGTDGVDGPTDAAGAVATGRTLERAREAGLDVDAALADNDAHPLLEALGDLVVTGPTGTNVTDLMVVLVRASGRGG